jgi:hypothetical protein
MLFYFLALKNQHYNQIAHDFAYFIDKNNKKKDDEKDSNYESFSE